MRRIRRGAECRPKPQVAPRQQHDRRRPYRRGAALAATATRGEARPYEAARQALLIEPGGLVLADPARQQLRLPRAGRRLETLELREDHTDRIGALHPRLAGDPLPFEQEAQEVARIDRLDLSAQSLDGVAVDARKETPLAPLVGPGRVRGEGTAHREAFGLQRGERGIDARQRNSE